MPTAIAEKETFSPRTGWPEDCDYIKALGSSVAGVGKENLSLRVPQYVSVFPAPWEETLDADSLLDRLENLGISITNRDAVLKYLPRHLDLPHVVWEVAYEVRRVLPELPLVLELASVQSHK